MTFDRCKSCGGDLERIGNYYVCKFCGSKWTIDADQDVHVIDRANAWSALRDCDFEHAVELFENIIFKEPENHEAYWGRALASAGIMYVTDLNEHKKVPTCNSISEESFISSSDVQKAIQLAPADISDTYQVQAEQIENIRSEWVKKASKETPYDIFICYKDSDREHNIDRTDDSYDAQELYNALVEEGYKVFFSRVSLRSKVSEHYEPYIYNAIKTAKVMIVFGEKPEYFNAVWVKNEWMRFRKRIELGEKHPNSLVVVYKNMAPADLPAGLRSRQCLDATEITFLDDLKKHMAGLRKSKAKDTDENSKDRVKPIKINPLHEHIYTDEIFPASCVARGYTIHRCACGYEYKDNYTRLAEHKYAHKTTKEPTCTTSGYTEEVCSVCGDKKVNSIPAKGHTFGKWIEKTPPTCIVPGKKIRQCSECGYVEEQELPAKGHQWSPTEQRFDEHGNKEYVSFCKLCGEEKISKESEEDRKAKEAQAQLSKKSLGSAIGSGIIALSFFNFMIINFAGGEKIGWGIIFLLIAFACGGASISFTKEFIKLKPPLSEEEKTRRKKKITLILIGIIASIIIVVVIVVIVVRNNPKSQFEYTKHWRNDYVTIQGIKNENYAIKNETVEIPSTIDGMQVGLGSLVFDGDSFTTLVLPKNLQEIFSNSLDGCIGLKNIVYKGTISDWNSIEGVEDINISKYNFTHKGSCECNSWSTGSDYDCELGGTKIRSCLYCDKVYTETIAPTTHSITIIQKIEPTCSSIGKTEGSECSVCNKVLIAQEDIPKLSHTVVIDSAVSATCSTTGLTEGSHCSSCKTVLVVQKTVPKLSHTMSGWTTTTAAGCITTGTEINSCSKCSYNESRVIESKGHSFGATSCSNCGMEKPSEGLIYNSVADGYEVADIGSCTDTRIVLPDYYNGKPVVGIANSAFANVETISEIVMQEGLLRIGSSAFSYSSITTAKIPNSVNFIGEDAFDNCDSLISVYLGTGLTSTGGTIFAWCDELTSIYCPSVEVWCRASLRIFYCYGAQVYFNNVLAEEITIPGTIEKIEYEVFSDIRTLTTVRIAEGVKEISFGAFYDTTESLTYYKNFKTLYLPSTITHIGRDAFPYTIETVYYNGTMAEWAEVTNYEYFTKVVCTDGVVKQS